MAVKLPKRLEKVEGKADNRKLRITNMAGTKMLRSQQLTVNF